MHRQLRGVKLRLNPVILILVFLLTVNFFLVVNFFSTETADHPSSINVIVSGKFEEELPIRRKGQRITEGEFTPSKREHEKNWKNIVLWTAFNKKRKVWSKIFKRILENECEENRCTISTNQRDVQIADAVLFNVHDLQRKTDELSKEQEFYPPRSTRKNNQIYVFFSMEAPNVFAYRDINWSLYDNFFNWTMTYRRDSDVVLPYGKVKKLTPLRKNKFNFVTSEDLKKKSLAIWMVSHCPTLSKRENFVETLQRYIPIDIYGACGSKTCGSPAFIEFVNELEDDECNQVIRNYSFYMALENTLCKDYVTEKLYRSLSLGIVPVVLGGANYTQFAPPNSYIDARNFKTVKDLARYLQEVAVNPNLYNTYLKWKEEYEIELGSPYRPFVCDLCNKLHLQDQSREMKAYPSIRSWFLDEAKCFAFKNI